MRLLNARKECQKSKICGFLFSSIQHIRVTFNIFTFPVAGISNKIELKENRRMMPAFTGVERLPAAKFGNTHVDTSDVLLKYEVR